MKKEVAIIGLGKMGKNMALRLKERRWKVLGLDKGYFSAAPSDSFGSCPGGG